ncbi:MAG: C40 family peptidase [Candidatus Eremiobacterota bacterium]
MKKNYELVFSAFLAVFIVVFILLYTPELDRYKANIKLLPGTLSVRTERKSVITGKLPELKYTYNQCSTMANYTPARPLSSRGSSIAAKVVQTAYKYIGDPYVWGGESPGGFDCSGFVQWVYTQNGISITRTADTQYMEGIPVKDLEPGDLVFFTTYAPGASHVGIYLACSKFIHASSSGQVKINSLDEEFYKSVFIGGRRYFR